MERQRKRYFLATTSTGLRAIRGSATKEYKFACVSTNRLAFGSVIHLWSTREDLANRSRTTAIRNWNCSTTNPMNFEVVKTIEVTPKEAKKIKAELHIEMLKHQHNTFQQLELQTQKEKL